jgi:hypothetical protein
LICKRNESNKRFEEREDIHEQDVRSFEDVGWKSNVLICVLVE